MLAICLLIGFLVMVFGGTIEQWTRQEVAKVQLEKELASWNRVKELGFDDVIEWEKAFQEATGALPDNSRVKELEDRAKMKYELDQQRMALAGSYYTSPIRTGNYQQRSYRVYPG